MNYPNATGHLRGSDTSKEAAEHLDETGRADGQLNQVEALLSKALQRGMTADELRVRMEKDWPGLHNSIVSARLARLVNLGRAVRTGETRRASTGRSQGIYIHADYATADMLKPIEPIPDKRPDSLKEFDAFLRAMYEVLESGKVPRIMPGGPFHNKLRGRYDKS